MASGECAASPPTGPAIPPPGELVRFAGVSVEVQLRKDAPRVIPAKGPWIRMRHVSKVLGPPDPGALARVIDRRGHVVAWGLYSPDSELVVRILQFGEAPVHGTWLEARIATALVARTRLGFGSGETTGFREINSEGDGLPGLVVDRYGGLRVAQITTAPMAVREAAIVDALDEPGITTVVLRPERAARLEGFEPGLSGTPPPLLDFLEHGLRFRAPAPPAQKTGAYLDQRDNRARLAKLAQAQDAPLLDVGCHIGGFSIHAASQGVRCVALDRSAGALEWVQRNAEGLAAPVEVVEADMFSGLDALDSLDIATYGTIVFDPPKVATSEREVPRAVGAMRRSVTKLLARLAPCGVLAVCSCSHHLDVSHLDQATEGHAQRLTRIAVWGPGVDHPVAPGHHQGEYLRVAVYQRRS